MIGRPVGRTRVVSATKAKTHSVTIEDKYWDVCAKHGGASAILRQFAQDKIAEQNKEKDIKETK